MKKFEKFWNLSFDSIQEPPPHHTVLCLSCGALYNREEEIEKKCKSCGKIFTKNKTSEFFVGKDQIHFGKNLEWRRNHLSKK